MRANIPKGMGGGPQNMQSMIRQAQKMQEDMAAKQEELDAREYDISAGDRQDQRQEGDLVY